MDLGDLGLQVELFKVYSIICSSLIRRLVYSTVNVFGDYLFL